MRRTVHFNLRTTMLATIFSVGIAAGFTGLTLTSGESHESSLEESCARSAWPNIPAACLEGGSGEAVRYVSADDEEHEEIEMELRFANAFN
jgi:hypothetical protein